MVWTIPRVRNIDFTIICVLLSELCLNLFRRFFCLFCFDTITTLRWCVTRTVVRQRTWRNSREWRMRPKLYYVFRLWYEVCDKIWRRSIPFLRFKKCWRPPNALLPLMIRDYCMHVYAPKSRFNFRNFLDGAPKQWNKLQLNNCAYLTNFVVIDKLTKICESMSK